MLHRKMIFSCFKNTFTRDNYLNLINLLLTIKNAYEKKTD